MAAMVVWLAVLGVLCATLPLSAAIELSRLYEHMEGVRFKRSGKLTQAGTHSFFTQSGSPSITNLYYIKESVTKALKRQLTGRS